MKQIIVATDFTAASRNALEWVCQLVPGGASILLRHIFTMPVSYTSEGLALASLHDALDIAEQELEGELGWLMQQYPAVKADGRIVTGTGFSATLQEAIAQDKPDLVVMPAAADYAELWTWDQDMLTALTDTNVPILLVPRHTTWQGLHHIGFACDYRYAGTAQQAAFLSWLTATAKAKLHVVHVTRAMPAHPDEINRNTAHLHQLLEGLQPQYHSIEDPNVIEAVTQFVKDEHIDFMIVIPHKHDVWYSLFHQSHTRQLARLNHIPVLALHD